MKEKDIVWAEQDGIIRKYMIIQVFENEGKENRYMLKPFGSDNLVMADSAEDLYTDEMSCRIAYEKRYKEEYDAYYSNFNTLEELLAYLIHMASTKRNVEPLNPIEMEAAMKRASEFSGIDMIKYLKQCEEDMTKEEDERELEKAS